MWLCPFLIIVTDRRSAEKDGENEKESGDFVIGVFVCMWMIAVGWVWVWTSPDIFFFYRLKPFPTPHPFYSLSHVSNRDVSSQVRMDKICAKQSQLIYKLVYKEVTNFTDFFLKMEVNGATS